MPPEPTAILQLHGSLYVHPQFQRNCNALKSSHYLIIDRKNKCIESKQYKEKHTISDLFIQAVQLKSPGLLKHLKMNNGNRTPQTCYNRYNGRSKCCFNNVMINKESSSIKFTILPHSYCTVKDLEMEVIRSKIKKWYCCTD